MTKLRISAATTAVLFGCLAFARADAQGAPSPVGAWLCDSALGWEEYWTFRSDGILTVEYDFMGLSFRGQGQWAVAGDRLIYFVNAKICGAYGCNPADRSRIAQTYAIEGDRLQIGVIPGVPPTADCRRIRRGSG